MARIFVVEDDAVLRGELMRLLELQGHEALASTAFDRIADEALAADPDCVLLDLKLPGDGGHAVCRDLRSASDVPIVMLTSSDNEFDEVMSMNLGADDYVTKPYQPRRAPGAHRSRCSAVRRAPSRRRASSTRASCWTWREAAWSTRAAAWSSPATSSACCTCSWRTRAPSSRARSS